MNDLVSETVAKDISNRMDIPNGMDIRIGIDIGGTFTDFVIYIPASGVVSSFKLLSTPHNPAQVVLEGLGKIYRELPKKDRYRVDLIHGSTVATNALLERKGARTALVTTAGFRDVLQIGRQNRPELYDLSVDPPPAIIPRDSRFVVDERVNFRGEVLRALDAAELEPLIRNLKVENIESVAVCLLFSFLHPDHENMIADWLREDGYFVSTSSEVLPEYREYERTSTTAINAYVSPILDRYLNYLESGLPENGFETLLRVMQSNGGSIGIAEARANGVRCILSGPAGGVVGAQNVARLLKSTSEVGHKDGQSSEVRVISFDMGGTSTDVSLVEGEPKVTTEASVGGYPIRIPVLDIHTIGAGGGSIASVDAGGALRVGPQSAGADPGPACYGKGEFPTVTDANLVLGRLAADYFLGGEMPLEGERAVKVISELGDQLNLDPQRTALGVVEIINAHMERAIRVISVERGHDPRDFCLLSFGGAGGLHAVDLARRSGIKKVLVPPMASTLSAYGMLAVDVIKDYSQTVMMEVPRDPSKLEGKFAPLVGRGIEALKREGIPDHRIKIGKYLDMRYKGQSYELILPYSDSLEADFHALHRDVYGYDQPDAPVEIVNIRVQAVGSIPSPTLLQVPAGGADADHAKFDERPVIYRVPEGEEVGKVYEEINTPLYRWDRFKCNNRIPGPAVVVRSDTTVLLEPGDQGVIDPFGNLSITIAGTQAGS